MFNLLIGVAIGLVLGWNFLPQPAWVKSKLAELLDKFK